MLEFNWNIVFSIIGTVATMVASAAGWAWKQNSDSVKQQTVLLANIDKNLAVALQRIDNHHEMLTEGKMVHREFREKFEAVETRLSRLEAKQ